MRNALILTRTMETKGAVLRPYQECERRPIIFRDGVGKPRVSGGSIGEGLRVSRLVLAGH